MFDRGKLNGRFSFAYEILQLEQLSAALLLAKLIRHGWLRGPPQKYVYANAALKSHLSSLSLATLFRKEDNKGTNFFPTHQGQTDA